MRAVARSKGLAGPARRQQLGDILVRCPGRAGARDVRDGARTGMVAGMVLLGRRFRELGNSIEIVPGATVFQDAGQRSAAREDAPARSTLLLISVGVMLSDALRELL